MKNFLLIISIFLSASLFAEQAELWIIYENGIEYTD